MKQVTSSGTSTMMVRSQSAKCMKMKSLKLNASAEITWEKFTITTQSECSSEDKKDGGMLTCCFTQEWTIIRLFTSLALSNFRSQKARTAFYRCQFQSRRAYDFKISDSFTLEVCFQQSSSLSFVISLVAVYIRPESKRWWVNIISVLNCFLIKNSFIDACNWRAFLAFDSTCVTVFVPVRFPHEENIAWSSYWVVWWRHVVRFMSWWRTFFISFFVVFCPPATCTTFHLWT